MESLAVLAGGIAHNFNNLLVGVLCNAEFALDALPPESPLLPMVVAIQSAARRTADLTHQMLACSAMGPRNNNYPVWASSRRSWQGAADDA